MSSKFGIILDILLEFFSNPVSENDYHNIVNAIREYSNARENNEQHELAIRGLPSTYHPCDHNERIRYAMVFGEKNNMRIGELISRVM